MGRNEAEILVDLDVPRERVAPTTKFRSTWIVSSQNAIRDCGFFERYTKLIPEMHRETLMAPVVGVWFPSDVVYAHYTACDRLGLSAVEREAIAYALMRPAHRKLLSITSNVAKHVGLTPWMALAQSGRIWERTCIGGGIVVYREGPKEARVELLGLTLASIPYFRLALRDLLITSGKLLATAFYVKESFHPAHPLDLTYRASWV
ncbi:hypothetical protein [Pendulispora albinea]|uniref:Uncharacterized protein n=1 Tax=Pendulispora albinea TaxID=2741071 RepID=A0ABZ2LVT0_9BACT